MYYIKTSRAINFVILAFRMIVAHEAAIGNTIGAIGPYSAIASEGSLSCDTSPSLDPLWLPTVFVGFLPNFVGVQRDTQQMLKGARREGVARLPINLAKEGQE